MIRKLLFKNFMLLYRSSQWLRTRFTHNGLMLLAVLVAAAIFGIDTRQTYAYQVFSFFFSLLLLTLLWSLFLRGRYQARRYLPDYGTAGEPLKYRLNVRNESNSPLASLLVMDELKPVRPAYSEFQGTRDLQDRERNLVDRIIGYPRLVNLIRNKRGADIHEKRIDTLAPHTQADVQIELFPARRGYIYFDNTVIARTDPLGLIKKRTRVANPERFLVLPKCYRIPDISLGGSRRHQPGGLNQSLPVGDSEEFHSLRDYRPGDPVRAIHWRSYARRGEPVIREYKDEFFSRMALVLDTYNSGQPAYLFEEAVSVAASIVLANHHPDALLDLLLVNNEAWRLTAGRGLADTRNMLEVLACVAPASSGEFDRLGELVLEHSVETSNMVLVLLRWQEQQQALVRQLRQMQIPLLVIVITDAGQEQAEMAEFDPMADRPDLLWQLQAGQVQQALDQQQVRDHDGKF